MLDEIIYHRSNDTVIKYEDEFFTSPNGNNEVSKQLEDGNCAYAFRKRKSIVKQSKSKYWQRTHKYWIRVPKFLKEALNIYKVNGNNLWRDAVKKEMPKIDYAVVENYGDVYKKYRIARNNWTSHIRCKYGR